MKKIKLNTAKLQLNKEKITELNSQEMGNIKGGFTYSLSLGAVCRVSKDYTATNPKDCGILVSLDPGVPNGN